MDVGKVKAQGRWLATLRVFLKCGPGQPVEQAPGNLDSVAGRHVSFLAWAGRTASVQGARSLVERHCQDLLLTPEHGRGGQCLGAACAQDLGWHHNEESDAHDCAS